MHRIVSGDADGFVTQGDNNDWLDQDRPCGRRDPRRPLRAHPAGREGARRAPVARRARHRRHRGVGRRRTPEQAPGPAHRSVIAPPLVAPALVGPAFVAPSRPRLLDAGPGARPSGRAGFRRGGPARGGRLRRARHAAGDPDRDGDRERDPAGTVHLLRGSRTRHHLPDRRHRDRRHCLDPALGRPDRVLHEHGQRPGPGRCPRPHAAGCLGRRTRRLERDHRQRSRRGHGGRDGDGRPSPSTPLPPPSC